MFFAVSPPPTQDEILVFLENFPTPAALRYYQPEDFLKLWVFWREDEEGSDHQIHSSSSAADLHPSMPFHKTIRSVFSKLTSFFARKIIFQLWAPVTIDGKRLLSTSTQPFAINKLKYDGLKRYRLRSMEYHFNIDFNNNQLHNQQEEEEEEDEPPIILSGGPAYAFLNRMGEVAFLKDRHGMSQLARYALDFGFKYSFMLPICYSTETSSCIGVIECTTCDDIDILNTIKGMRKALEEADLSICPVQEHIPYKTINGLNPAKDDIEAALQIVCLSHNLLLSQVWITCTDENHVPFSSLLEDTRTKRVIALKLTGYVNKSSTDYIYFVGDYFDICDVVCLKAGEELVEKTLQDYKPRFCRKFSNSSAKTLMSYNPRNNITRYLAICLRSVETGDLDYAFEFIWLNTSNYFTLLKALLLTLKDCLPNFKFASGAELDYELELHLIDDFPYREIKSFKIFQGKKTSTIPCKAKWKTTPKELPREVIEEQFGNTMKKAAENLKVSLSTLKRKCKDYHIDEWQGPKFLKKEKVNNASGNNQSNRNEEDNNRMDNTLTIKAEYAGDTIKFDLHISEATFVNVDKEIGMNFNLTHGTYKLNYRDEDGDWILLGSDQHMKYCIKRLRNLGQTVVRLRVLPSPQQPSSYALSNLFVP